jgi:two-component system OmpR family response regulator
MDHCPHILVVDDHSEIRELISENLSRQGFKVTELPSGHLLLDQLRSAKFDAIILDVMMPGPDGFELCRNIRKTDEIPILFLTAMASETDRVVGLELGADDYIVKPFSSRELVARVKAILRRTTDRTSANEQSLPSDLIRFDRWTLNSSQREVTDESGVAVILSTAEYRLLEAFLQNPGRVLTRDQLLDMTVGRMASPIDRSIDNHISRLRKKLETDPKKPRLIQTHWGGGYRFTGRAG